MTRTETDLREALASLAATADLPVRAPVASRPRRAARVVAVAAVLVVGLAVVVLSVLRSAGDDTSAPPLGPSATVSTPAPTTTGVPVATAARPQDAWFTLDPASGWVVTARVDTPTVQTGYVRLPSGSRSYVDVALHAPGTFDPSSAEAGTPVTVQGVAGWRAPLVDPVTGITTTAYVWPYGSDAWAVVSDRSGTSGGMPDDQLRSVAEAVRTGDPAGVVPLPFTLGALPAGLTVDVVYSSPGEDVPEAAVGLADDRAGDPNRATADGGALTVMFSGALARPTGAPDRQLTGHPAWLTEPSAAAGTGRELVVDYGGTVGLARFSVDPLHVDRYGDDVLLALAAATTPVADVSAGATWVPAASGALR